MSLACGQRYRGGVSVNPSSREAGGDLASGDSARSSVKHRPSWIAFVVLGAIVCLAMGIWQLARYQEASGTVQNLGYTFMWPFLAGFLIYAYMKYVRLEADEADRLADEAQSAADGDVIVAGGVPAGVGRDDDDNDEDPAHPRPQSPAAGSRVRSARRGRRPGPVVTEIPADLLPTRRPTVDAQARDEGLDAYNSYLAELTRQDNTADDHSQESPAS